MHESVQFFLQLAYFFIPGYLANAAPPVLYKLFPRWSAPMDFGKSWGGRRILGEHKTWRGAIGGTIIGGLAFLAQRALTPDLRWVPYSSLPWWYGFLLAFGAIVIGDSGKSFFKRRLNVKPGGHWIPFDQIDYTLGAFAASAWYFWPGLPEITAWGALLILLLVNGLGSVVAHLVAYTLRMSKEKF